MEYQKITNLLGSTSDKVPRFITKKSIEVYDRSSTADIIQTSKTNLPCVTTMKHILLLKETLLLKEQMIETNTIEILF